jgi:hypothetical protein
MQLLISIAFFEATPAHAEQYCIQPVAGGEPTLSVELDQPYRIATSPKVVPGFDGLVVKALNRHELYEFDGTGLSVIESDFPHVWGFAFEHGIHITPNSEAYGFGSDPKVIFYHRHSGWTPIDETQGYLHAFFDQGSGDVHWRSSSTGRLNSLADGQVQKRRDFPVFGSDQTVSVRTIPEIDGVLALTGSYRSIPSESSSIWFRASGGTWSKITIDLPEGHRLLDTFQDAKIQVIDGLIKIFPSNTAFAPLFLRISSERLVFAGSASRGDWQYHSPSETWIGWNGQSNQPIRKTMFGLWSSEAEPFPPKMFKLGSTEIEPTHVSGLEPPSETRGGKIFYRPQTVILTGDMPAFVSTKTGIATFDGTHLIERKNLGYEAIGNSPYIGSLGPFHFIQSEKGVFLLNDDLSLVHIDTFPIVQPWRHEVSIDYVSDWRTYVVVDRRLGKVYVSSDMQNFSLIGSAERITKFVGISPEPATVLLVGESGLFAIKNECAS